MPDSVAIAAFVFGAILILIAIIGGEFKLFGSEISKSITNKWLRFFCFFFGAALLVFALGIELPQSATVPYPNDETPTPGITLTPNPTSTFEPTPTPEITPTPDPKPTRVPVALAQNYYGAIAYSEQTGSHGYSYDYSSQRGAESSAVGECERYSKSGDCQVLIWFRNACGALATASNGAYGSGWGVNRGVAEQYALQSCGSSGCRVIRWVCTTR